MTHHQAYQRRTLLPRQSRYLLHQIAPSPLTPPNTCKALRIDYSVFQAYSRSINEDTRTLFSGTQGLKGHKLRSVIPAQLCDHIALICEE